MGIFRLKFKTLLMWLNAPVCLCLQPLIPERPLIATSDTVFLNASSKATITKSTASRNTATSVPTFLLRATVAGGIGVLAPTGNTTVTFVLPLTIMFLLPFAVAFFLTTSIIFLLTTLVLALLLVHPLDSILHSKRFTDSETTDANDQEGPKYILNGRKEKDRRTEFLWRENTTKKTCVGKYGIECGYGQVLAKNHVKHNEGRSKKLTDNFMRVIMVRHPSR